MFAYVWVRATLPRYRFDQLISLGWKIILPLSLVFFIFTAALLSMYVYIFALWFNPLIWVALFI